MDVSSSLWRWARCSLFIGLSLRTKTKCNLGSLTRRRSAFLRWCINHGWYTRETWFRCRWCGRWRAWTILIRHQVQLRGRNGHKAGLGRFLSILPFLLLLCLFCLSLCKWLSIQKFRCLRYSSNSITEFNKDEEKECYKRRHTLCCPPTRRSEPAQSFPVSAGRPYSCSTEYHRSP